jgi:ParB family transcriptional regulator, chromosome partitioning protein
MSTEKRRALGRGLDALLPSVRATTSSGASYGDGSVFLCPIEALAPQHGQPRQRIDEAKLEELAGSLREHGLIEPIVVRRMGAGNDRFEIIAGERRWRAAQRAGLKDVLVVVKDVSPAGAFELALIENLQREDLGAIEAAEAFERLIREHEYTHEALADRLHRDRTTITNALRLLKLPQRIRTLVVEGKLSEGHARALLGAPDVSTMESIADKSVRGKLSVRKVEQLVRGERKKGDGKPEKAPPAKSANLRDLEHKLTRHFGLRVEIRDVGNKGEVAVHYGSLDEFDRILSKLGMQ